MPLDGAGRRIARSPRSPAPEEWCAQFVQNRRWTRDPPMALNQTRDLVARLRREFGIETQERVAASLLHSFTRRRGMPLIDGGNAPAPAHPNKMTNARP